MLTLTPVALATANAFVNAHHRHHKATAGHKFSIGCAKDGELVGVAIVGRPVSRYLDDGWTLEVNRLCTTGEKNACSILYAASARAAKAMGYGRAFHILAITVCQADWDRRYSPDNRAWANAMSIPANPDAWGTDRNCYLAVSSHPGLVDLFLSQTRKAYAQEQQKTSVRDMLKKLPETTSPKISAKSKSPER